MKWLIYFLSALGALAQGLNPAVIGNAAKGAAAEGAACSTYDTTNAWDNFIEGFEVSGYESNVTYTVWSTNGSGSAVNPNADISSLTTGKPDGTCSQGWYINVPTDSTDTGAMADLGALIDIDTIQTDLYFSFYFTLGPDTANESYTIFTYRGIATASPTIGISLKNVAGTQTLLPNAAAGADGVSVATGQWYVIKLSLDTARAVDGSVMSVYSSGSLVGSDSFQRNAEDIRYLFIGAPAGLNSNGEGQLYFDLVAVKTN